MTTSIAIIGGGKLGTALGRQLASAGYRITGVCCRTPESAQRAGRLIPAGKAVTEPWIITPEAQITLITTPDSVIAGVYEEIVRHNGFSPGATVLHCSGSLPSTIMKAPGDSAIHKGSFHPLQSFAAPDTTGNPFQGVIAAIEGDDQALAAAAQIGKDIGAEYFPIRTEAKTLYHAAAVVASNYLVTILDIAFSLLESAGIDRQYATTILSPLINGTLTNIKTVGIPEALTGPIARGDVQTVADHLRSLKLHNKDRLAVYSLLGLETIKIASARGTLSPSRSKALRRLLTEALDG